MDNEITTEVQVKAEKEEYTLVRMSKQTRDILKRMKSTPGFEHCRTLEDVIKRLRNDSHKCQVA